LVSLAFLIKFIVDEFSTGLSETGNGSEYIRMLLILFKKDPFKNDLADLGDVSRIEASMCLSEKVEVNVRVNEFFSLALNSKIDQENQENMFYERIYQFYARLDPIVKDPDADKGNIDNTIKLKIKASEDITALDLVQFYIFIKDTFMEPYAGNKIETYRLYEF
jgi:hypothetical protein